MATRGSHVFPINPLLISSKCGVLVHQHSLPWDRFPFWSSKSRRKGGDSHQLLSPRSRFLPWNCHLWNKRDLTADCRDLWERHWDEGEIRQAPRRRERERETWGSQPGHLLLRVPLLWARGFSTSCLAAPAALRSLNGKQGAAAPHPHCGHRKIR